MGYLDRQAKRADKTQRRAANQAAWEAMTPEQRRTVKIITAVVIGILIVAGIVGEATSKNNGSSGTSNAAGSSSGGTASYSVTIQSQSSSSPDQLQVTWRVTNTGGTSGHPYCLVNANPSGFGDAVDPGQLDAGGSTTETTNLSVSASDYTPGTTAVVTCN